MASDAKHRTLIPSEEPHLLTKGTNTPHSLVLGRNIQKNDILRMPQCPLAGQNWVYSEGGV